MRHTILKILPPSKANIIINKKKLLIFIKNLIRIIPYPPNFNKIPAKIIDPPTGASTCALGSH
jgi:hypothetical protein